MIKCQYLIFEGNEYIIEGNEYIFEGNEYIFEGNEYGKKIWKKRYGNEYIFTILNQEKISSLKYKMDHL